MQSVGAERPSKTSKQPEDSNQKRGGGLGGWSMAMRSLRPAAALASVLALGGGSSVLLAWARPKEAAFGIDCCNGKWTHMH